MASDVGKVGIVGAGAMGSGIAQVAATGGLQVYLFDVASGAAARACKQIADRFAKRVEQGKMPADQAEQICARLNPCDALEQLSACDLVVEAIVEDLGVKTKLFQQLESIVRADAILASNTSSLPIGSIAAACRHKARIAGLHFFNPVPLMQLVEVIPGPATQAQVVERLVKVSQQMGRVPVVVKDSPGFLVNFGGRAYPTEALAITHETIATPAQVDAVMRDAYGFRMGPFELMDLTGIDVNFPVTRFIHEQFFADPRLRSTPQHRYLLDTRQLGRKTGQGFYTHSDQAGALSADTHSSAVAATRAFVPDAEPVLLELLRSLGVECLAGDDGVSPIIVAPLGEDCTAYAVRTGLDYRRIVAIDTLGKLDQRLTLMCAPGVDALLRDAVIARLQTGRKITLINDSPGFIGQRIAAMVANLGCEMAQTGVASPHDIDQAMRLGLNYPMGPLQMADHFGLQRLLGILETVQAITGDDRYRPSQWLRRRALLGLPAHAQ